MMTAARCQSRSQVNCLPYSWFISASVRRQLPAHPAICTINNRCVQTINNAFPEGVEAYLERLAQQKMAFSKGTGVKENKGRSEESIFSGLFQTIRQSLPKKTESKQEVDDGDGIIEILDDALQDACKVVRRSFSSATNSLNEMMRRASDNRRFSQPAVPPFDRLDSGISMDYGRRMSQTSAGPTRRASGMFARVPIQQMPTKHEDNLPSSARRVASSALSSIQSLLGIEERGSEENQTAIATQQPDGLDDGAPLRYRYTESRKKSQCDPSRVQESVPPDLIFKITYHASQNKLEVNFSCRPGFINSFLENGKANIVCKLRLSPGKRAMKIILQKGKTQYSKGSAFFTGLSAAELGGQTLNVMIVSKKKTGKMDLMLWRSSVRLQDLAVNESIQLIWSE